MLEQRKYFFQRKSMCRASKSPNNHEEINMYVLKLTIKFIS